MDKTRSRSRSAHRCADNPSSAGRSKKAKDSLPPDAPAECRHVPPPPHRPAGPFALYFAANVGSVDAKNVSNLA